MSEQRKIAVPANEPDPVLAEDVERLRSAVDLAATDDSTSTVIVVIRRGAFRVIVGLGELAPIEDQIFAAAIQRKITGQPAVLPRGRE